MKLAQAAVGCLGVGAILMLGFDAPLTRVVGVLALCAFVVCGVFAIAAPGWLEEEEET